MKLSFNKQILWVGIFGTAMALLETAVVIYLRKIYFPEGFDFPLKRISDDILVVELCREVATIVMLLSIGVFIGKTVIERFCWFIYCFAIWDFFYYVFLKVFLDWPASFFTWDVLFLIPMVWTSPVLAPVICCISMVFLSLSMLVIKRRNPDFKTTVISWCSWILGSVTSGL